VSLSLQAIHGVFDRVCGHPCPANGPGPHLLARHRRLRIPLAGIRLRRRGGKCCHSGRFSAASDPHSKAHIDPGIGPAPEHLRVWPVRRQVFRRNGRGSPACSEPSDAWCTRFFGVHIYGLRGVVEGLPSLLPLHRGVGIFNLLALIAQHVTQSQVHRAGRDDACSHPPRHGLWCRA
jgi:hypothetical protein